ncbi:T-complex protein 11-domain-containing protein [Amylocarpus encephaloides]|uniref:T-complex protein 11-domain-containing protein n=1 Tax=Amylocarpus encephaloides TaxID=45428 RepID=A0A9P7YUQ3_9HELO|nr:T-complex protein 11-domain-containing protein [Amylocarpus encephaloides]
MDSDASKRARGNSNSIAPANGRSSIPANENATRGEQEDRPETPENTEGEPMATEAEDASKPHGLDHEDSTYGIQSQKNQGFGNSPRDVFRSNSITSIQLALKPQTSLEPPVTKGTLSELDVNKIVHNPRLRHDINFDPDLHFRPNIDGEKGRKKHQKSAHFWGTLRSQLQEYLSSRDQFDARYGEVEWALPATLNAIRGILETLVPQKDRASVEETFNVELLMQQFRMGVADLVKLANWLSQLLKCHCAPMRDDWVDEMVVQLSNGDRNGDVDLLVEGMTSLLSVLEAMKLDVANHQIRCLRPILIEDTVHFEQKYFMKKIAMGKLNLAESHAWYKQASRLPDLAPLAASIQGNGDPMQGNTRDFMKALVYLTLPSRARVVPPTFSFDEDRMSKLRTDMQDLINLEVCMHLYRGLESQNRQEVRQNAREDTPVSFTSSPFDRPTSPADSTMLSSPTIPQPHHFTSRTKHPASIRAMSGRQIFMTNAVDGLTTSSGSSPRSSPASIASTPDTNCPTPFYLSVPISDNSTQARASLQAILASSSTTEKWNSLSPSVALEILRMTSTSLTRLPHFESHLAFHLSNPNSRLYQEAEQRVLGQLFPVLQKLVASYTPLTSVQIFEAAIAPKPGPNNMVNQANGSKDEISEIATRIAHMGILHWRVWAPLAYLIDSGPKDITKDPARMT